MKYVFAMIAGGLMITTSFLSGAVVGGWFVSEVNTWHYEKENKKQNTMED